MYLTSVSILASMIVAPSFGVGLSSFAASPTEGALTDEFVAEPEMKADMLQMLADFSKYIKADFQACEAPNSDGELCGCFKGEDTMANNERGVRPNADLSMICAFLVKYGKDKVTLPAGVTWQDLEDLAMKSLVFSYSTHKANKLKVCKGNNYWGSTSKSDSVWESSLWAMSVAYSAFFQWDKLTEKQKGYIKALLTAECNYELERSIPTGFNGDTKAEENGWEADVLAAALGLFPDDPLAPKWFDRLREFAINSYSHASDADNETVIDPEYDGKRVKDLYVGKNLFDDYTLQNHNLFHTSYQNVVMQELGEAALALKMFQLGVKGEEKWKTNALMHNNQKVQDEVLNWLALADGELAMPNGNDWSLFLYDQITSYSTMACFLRDPNALMLENRAYKFIKARQTTTPDGSWLLNPDVGARRMGVEGHRVMMSYLMHDVLPTADLTPTSWSDFRDAHSDAMIFPSQNVVRAMSDTRFTCFSWSTGLKSYTGYIASNSFDKNKIIVPLRQNGTGNFLGWYEVAGKGTNVTPVVSGIYSLSGNAYTMNGEINTNDASLNNRFAIYSTPGNAVIYLDYVRANADVTINKEKGGLMAISVDPFTSTSRKLYAAGSDRTSDGGSFVTYKGDWTNIDNEVGFVTRSGKSFGFGDKGNNNSIQTAKIYPLYSDVARKVSRGDVVDRRHVVYYSCMDAPSTKEMADELLDLSASLPEGWNGVIAADAPGLGQRYLLISNFVSDTPANVSGISFEQGAPVFTVPTTIENGKSSAVFSMEMNHSVGAPVYVYVSKSTASVKCVVDAVQSDVVYILNEGNTAASVDVDMYLNPKVSGSYTVAPGKCLKVYNVDGSLKSGDADFPTVGSEDLTKGYVDITAAHFGNASFETDKTYGDVGKVTLGSVVYDPCYVNTVAPLAKDFPNILPVQDWTYAGKLNGASNYARMYSMPYSISMMCASPSDVGNYTAQCARPMSDPSCGDRVLTVLNSWTSGVNRISKSVTLPEGDYRVLVDMKYECPNQSASDGKTVKASDNVNTSLTGVKLPSEEMYAYPSAPNEWETLVFDFSLDSEKPVEISLGYSSSKSVGAANNTLLYIDNVRLLTVPGAGVDMKAADNAIVDVYSVSGVCVRRGVTPTEALDALPAGVYIVGGKKVMVK